MDELMFDYATKEYVQARIAEVMFMAANSSGGGGGGGSGAVYATFTEDNGTWSCDKTFAELKAAYDAGGVIVGLAPRPGRTGIEVAAVMSYDEAHNVLSATANGYSSFDAVDNVAHLRSWVMGIISSGGVDTVVVEYHEGDIEVTNQS